MSIFDKKLQEIYSIISEQPTNAPVPASTPESSASGGAAASALPDAGGITPSGGGGIGGMSGPEPTGQTSGDTGDLENEVKRDTDPQEYTRSILSLLVDKKEGVTPEMFDDFVDSVSLAITKIKDKEGLKQFYGGFYRRLNDVLKLREELKSMFKQLSGTLEDLVGAQSEPDEAGGGIGKAGPSGPGVK